MRDQRLGAATDGQGGREAGGRGEGCCELASALRGPRKPAGGRICTQGRCKLPNALPRALPTNACWAGVGSSPWLLTWTQHGMHAPEAAASGRGSTAEWEAALLPLRSTATPGAAGGGSGGVESDSLRPVLE